MKRILAAAAASLALIAGQAAAGSDAALRVGDRVGSVSDTADQMEGGDGLGMLIFVGAIIGVLIVAVTIATDNDETPTSP